MLPIRIQVSNPALIPDKTTNRTVRVYWTYLEQSRHHHVIRGTLAIGRLELERLSSQLLLKGLVVHALVGGVIGRGVGLSKRCLHASMRQGLEYRLLGQANTQLTGQRSESRNIVRKQKTVQPKDLKVNILPGYGSHRYLIEGQRMYTVGTVRYGTVVFCVAI